MARPREFDLDMAVDRAMRLFWSAGYEEASLSELLATMKISKGSFYKAFNDKQSIYLTALQRYDETVIGEAVSWLRSPENGSGRNRIFDLFRKVESSAATEDGRLGCFLCNAMVDKAAAGGEIEKRLQAMVGRFENAFYSALEDEAANCPEIPQSFLRETARGLLSLYFGLQVLGRAGMASGMAADCIRQAARLIEPIAQNDDHPGVTS